MADSRDLKFFLTQIDLPHLVTIGCDVGPSVDTYPVNVHYHLIRWSFRGVSLFEGHPLSTTLAQPLTQCAALPVSDILYMYLNAS